MLKKKRARNYLIARKNYKGEQKCSESGLFKKNLTYKSNLDWEVKKDG